MAGMTTGTVGRNNDDYNDGGGLGRRGLNESNNIE
jgi:hypothetical protein